MSRVLRASLRTALITTPLCALYFAYWTAFAAWNTAVPHTDVHAWQLFFYKMAACFVVSACLWTLCFITFRRRRRAPIGATS